MTKKGEITVFMALMLTVLLSFLVTVIESARVNTIRFQIECAADMALYSALAEYQRTLLERYDLFFIDISYGQKKGDLYNVQEHIREYLAYNLAPAKELFVPKQKDFFALKAETIAIEDYSLATDEDCLVLKSQAVSYMKDKIGLTKLDELIEQSNIIKKENMRDGISVKRSELHQNIDSYNHQSVKVSEEEWIEVEVDNPAENIPIQESGLPYLVTKDAQGLSGTKIVKSNYVSERALNAGSGTPPERVAAKGVTDELLFGEYLLENCGFYTEQREGALLSYQIEYILGGKEQDLENLKSVLYQMLAIREVSNYLYLSQDGKKQAKAETLALGVSAVFLIPELKELIKQALLLGWAYTESVNDIKILMEGGKVPLIKSEKDWHMELTDMFHYHDCLGSGAGKNNGLSYEDYLRALLFMQEPKEKANRFGDIVEMDTRKISKQNEFRLDNCIESMEVYIEVSSEYGYIYDLKRRYGFEILE